MTCTNPPKGQTPLVILFCPFYTLLSLVFSLLLPVSVWFLGGGSGSFMGVAVVISEVEQGAKYKKWVVKQPADKVAPTTLAEVYGGFTTFVWFHVTAGHILKPMLPFYVLRQKIWQAHLPLFDDLGMCDGSASCGNCIWGVVVVLAVITTSANLQCGRFLEFLTTSDYCCYFRHRHLNPSILEVTTRNKCLSVVAITVRCLWDDDWCLSLHSICKSVGTMGSQWRMLLVIAFVMQNVVFGDHSWRMFVAAFLARIHLQRAITKWCLSLLVPFYRFPDHEDEVFSPLLLPRVCIHFLMHL